MDMGHEFVLTSITINYLVVLCHMLAYAYTFKLV